MAFNKFKLPPMLKKPEIIEDFEDSEQRERKRWGEQDDWNRAIHTWLINISSNMCDCFRWIYQVIATVDDTGFGAQAIFVLPPQFELEDNEYQLVFARGSFEYHNILYTIIPATNTITFVPGVLLGEAVTIYAVKHDDVQEVFYEVCAVPAAPYAYSPPVLVDRSGGRQLVFARNSHRFLDSGRPGDEYTVSNTLNTLSLTAGLGPVDAMSALVRLRECGCIWHEEVLAGAPGQTVFAPANPGNVVREHQTLRMIVAQRTTYLHPGFDFTTDVMANTITINAPGLAVGQPLNMWFYRG